MSEKAKGVFFEVGEAKPSSVMQSISEAPLELCKEADLEQFNPKENITETTKTVVR